MIEMGMQLRKEMKLDDHEFVLLRDFITQHFGIYYDHTKRWLLESKLSRLLYKYDFKSFLEYYHFLTKKFYVSNAFNDPDFIELAQAISNNETYFYREPVAFEIMTRFIVPHLVEQKKTVLPMPVRILSAGCSTGEEAYSIFISLHESNKLYNNIQLQIIGNDIDHRVLTIANSGVYQSEIFRKKSNIPDEIIHKYFISMKGQDVTFHGNKENIVLRKFLKEFVEFHQTNILNTQEMKRFGQFDIIFCRNVLIYFNEESTKKAVHNFSQIMNPGGYLFLGHSESIIGLDSCFIPVEKNKYIFYQKP